MRNANRIAAGITPLSSPSAQSAVLNKIMMCYCICHFRKQAYGIAIIEACKARVTAYQEDLSTSKRSKASASFNIHDVKAVRTLGLCEHHTQRHITQRT
jgi:hypothetical protein